MEVAQSGVGGELYDGCCAVGVCGGADEGGGSEAFVFVVGV